MKNDDYKLAVLLSAYNGEKYIKAQIDSILNQNNFSNITLIIRDDGSTDNTLSILNEYSNDPNVKIICGQNLGLIDSFFSLLEFATKEEFDYYSFCDQDDKWLPDKLETAVKAIQKLETAYSGPILYGSCSCIVDENLKPSGKTTQKLQRPLTLYNTAIQNIVIGHTQVLNDSLAKIIVKSVARNKKDIYSQDYWITTVASVVGKIIFDNTPHVLYRMHGDNQLGYGQNKINRAVTHIKRLKDNETRLMSVQLYRFLCQFKNYLSPEELNELKSFYSASSSLVNRVNYIRKTKLYRQSKLETIAFKNLYLLGTYNL